MKRSVNFRKITNKVKIYCILTLFFTMFTSSNAGSYPDNYFGIGFDLISGSGLSYSIDLDSRNSFSANGFYYYFGTDAVKDMKYQGNLGISYNYSIYNSDKSRSNIFVATSFYYFDERYQTVTIYNNVKRSYSNANINRIWNHGIGFNYQYLIDNTVSISPSIGLYYQKSASFADANSLFDRDPLGTSFWGIGAGLAIRVKF
jgi:hypothetical protein